MHHFSSPGSITVMLYPHQHSMTIIYGMVLALEDLPRLQRHDQLSAVQIRGERVA